MHAVYRLHTHNDGKSYNHMHTMITQYNNYFICLPIHPCKDPLHEFACTLTIGNDSILYAWEWMFIVMYIAIGSKESKDCGMHGQENQLSSYNLMKINVMYFKKCSYHQLI